MIDCIYLTFLQAFDVSRFNLEPPNLPPPTPFLDPPQTQHHGADTTIRKIPDVKWWYFPNTNGHGGLVIVQLILIFVLGSFLSVTPSNYKFHL